MRTHAFLQFLSFSAIAVTASNSRPRFSVYWNIPDRCSKMMKQPDYFSFLDRFNIIRNTNGHIQGDNITILYSKYFKHYAHFKINATTRTVINEYDGGVPQRANLTAFFQSAENVINKYIPDVHYSGPVILDFEEYRFKYYYNWGTKTPYQRKSDEYTALKYPNISSKAILARSEYEFNEAARIHAIGLIRLGKRMRPNAQWGFYLMPECSGHYEMTTAQCTTLYGYNSEMAELFNEQTAIFPSIYYEQESPSNPNYRSTQIRLREARRFSLTPKGRTPIYAYSKIEYDAYTRPTWYYTKADLCASLQASFEEGIQGLIIWGPDRQPWKERCPAMKKYIENVFGPVVVNIQRKAEKCARKMCSGRGTCLRPGELLKDCKWSLKDKLHEMICLCDEGYYGDHCELRKPKRDQKKPLKKYLNLMPETFLSTTTATIEEIDMMPVSPPSAIPVVPDFELMSVSPPPPFYDNYV